LVAELISRLHQWRELQNVTGGRRGDFSREHVLGRAEETIEAPEKCQFFLSKGNE
jgi:hypothetical protein